MFACDDQRKSCLLRVVGRAPYRGARIAGPGVAQTRSPTTGERSVGSAGSRLMVAFTRATWYQHPLRRLGVPPGVTGWTHSQAFPAMSSIPKGLLDLG